MQPQLTDAELRVDGRVAVFTMRRDDVRNALTGTTLVDDLLATVAWINANEDISALVITGDGRAFSSGGNLKHMLAREADFAGDVHTLQQHYRQGIQRMPLAMRTLEVPSIAAINGAAVGAGFDLTCMCDIRLAARGAQMGETFVNLGIIPGDGGAWLLQRVVGYQRAAELTFSGRLIDADEAQRIGLVLEVLEPGALLARALALAGDYAAKPPRALRMAKRLMMSAQRLELADFLDQCAMFQAMCHHTEDHMEAVRAAVEKRPPKFSGR